MGLLWWLLSSWIMHHKKKKKKTAPHKSGCVSVILTSVLVFLLAFTLLCFVLFILSVALYFSSLCICMWTCLRHIFHKAISEKFIMWNMHLMLGRHFSLIFSFFFFMRRYLTAVCFPLTGPQSSSVPHRILLRLRCSGPIHLLIICRSMLW